MYNYFTGKRPRQAFGEMLEKVGKRFKSSDEQAAVIQHLPSFSEVRCQLSTHRQQRCIPVPDPLNIPEELRTTLRGRQLDDDDVNKNEAFLMYSGQQGKCSSRTTFTHAIISFLRPMLDVIAIVRLSVRLEKNVSCCAKTVRDTAMES
jgi:hypothetical protein